MLYQKFSLSERYPDASLTAYVCAEEPKVAPRTAVLVCPGGGYHFLSAREAEPIVRRFFGEGMNVYLLEYSVGEKAANYAPLIEASLALKLIRQRAEIDNTNPDKIYVMGFSAGGHLAASAGVFWNLPVVRDAIGVTSGECPEGINRPSGIVLCYPVITGGEHRHNGSFVNLNGCKEPTAELYDRFSLEKHVDSTTPPAFIWHTFEDTCVPVQNSILFMDAMTKAGVPFESHIFPAGAHGFALATDDTQRQDPHVAVWTDLAVKWMRDF